MSRVTPQMKEMKRLYIEEEFPMRVVAERLNIHEETVRRNLKKMDVSTRSTGPQSQITEEVKEQIKYLYIEEELSMRDIAAKIGFGETVVHKYLHKMDVDVRSHSEALTGYEKAPEHIAKIADHHREHYLGENNPNWKGGVSEENHRIRTSADYREWRESVFERDDYTCQECEERGCYLEAHHIKPFAFFPESRFDVENGMTLCRDCHKDTFFGTTKKQYYRKNVVNSEEALVG